MMVADPYQGLRTHWPAYLILSRRYSLDGVDAFHTFSLSGIV